MFTTPPDIWTLRGSRKKGGHRPHVDTGFEEKNIYASTSWRRGRGATLVRSKSSSPNRQVKYLLQFLDSWLCPLYFSFAILITVMLFQILSEILKYCFAFLTVPSFSPSAAKVKEPGNRSSCELASLFSTLKLLHGKSVLTSNDIWLAFNFRRT